MGARQAGATVHALNLVSRARKALARLGLTGQGYSFSLNFCFLSSPLESTDPGSGGGMK